MDLTPLGHTPRSRLIWGQLKTIFPGKLLSAGLSMFNTHEPTLPGDSQVLTAERSLGARRFTQTRISSHTVPQHASGARMEPRQLGAVCRAAAPALAA